MPTIGLLYPIFLLLDFLFTYRLGIGDFIPPIGSHGCLFITIIIGIFTIIIFTIIITGEQYTFAFPTHIPIIQEEG